MNKRIILTSSLFGALAVVFGAFGAHSLKDKLTSSELEIWRTAVDYQFYHTLALLFLASFSRFKSRLINAASYMFTFGIILFSGSLYLLSTQSLTNLQWSQFIGPITPLGGVLFILGWLCLFLATLKNK
ncbi:MAG TPA: DUF423 domain-containing protein [Sphingobacteriaceae bacterium]|nr:DUF423 domain-containing protein [Sphingobacteriaceae bacterium]